LYLLKLLGVTAFVGMVLTGQLAEGTFDFVWGSGASNT
jgi:hypothetical protein